MNDINNIFVDFRSLEIYLKVIEMITGLKTKVVILCLTHLSLLSLKRLPKLRHSRHSVLHTKTHTRSILVVPFIYSAFLMTKRGKDFFSSLMVASSVEDFDSATVAPIIAAAVVVTMLLDCIVFDEEEEELAANLN